MSGASLGHYIFAGSAVALGPIALLTAWFFSVLCRPRRQAGSSTSQREVAIPQEVEKEAQPPTAAVPPKRPRSPRVLYFDFWRVLCVVCVVVTHANESYAEWNIFAVQHWVLQVIIVISGTCYGFSKASLLHLLQYESRLMAIFSFGVALNWLGMVVADKKWWKKIADDVLFQMAFIFLMFMGALVSFPMKCFLDTLRSKASTLTSCWVISLYVVSTVASGLCWKVFIDTEDSEDLDIILRSITLSSAMLLTAVVCTHLLPEPYRRMTGWLIFAWLYVTPVAYRNTKEGYWAHLIDVYSWSLLVQRVPLLGTETVGLGLVQTWPFWAIGGGLISIFPGVQGRKDKFPFEDWWDRAQYYPLELLCILAFVTIPTAGREKTVPLVQTWGIHLPWLNAWSLLAFCSHKALYYVVGGRPWGLTIMLLSPLPAFAIWYVVWGRKKQKSSTSPRRPDSEAQPEMSTIAAPPEIIPATAVAPAVAVVEVDACASPKENMLHQYGGGAGGEEKVVHGMIEDPRLVGRPGMPPV